MKERMRKEKRMVKQDKKLIKNKINKSKVKIR